MGLIFLRWALCALCGRRSALCGILIAIDRVGDEILVKTLGLNLSLFLKGMGSFVFRLTPYDSRLVVKRVREDEISESKKSE